MLNSAVVTAVERFVTASDEPFAIAKRISLTLNSGLPKCKVCFLLKKSKSGIAPTAIPMIVPSPAPIIPKSHTAIKRMSSTMFVQPDSIEKTSMICGLSAVTRYDWLSICQHITKPYGIITLP